MVIPMNAAELGRRIKEARISKKMTQSQVVGNFITRNMLSQIENGNALPSVPTLEYLAEVLDIPDILDFSSFSSLGEPKELTRAEKVTAALEAAKDAAVKGDWAAIAAMEDSYPEELADEFQALFAKAYLSMAKSTQVDAAAAAIFLRKADLLL